MSGADANGWMPIASAPKNVKWALTWGCPHEYGELDGETPSVQFSKRLGGGWYSREWGTHHPTHWQPLPEPPIPTDLMDAGEVL
jgi:hypothetical protein